MFCFSTSLSDTWSVRWLNHLKDLNCRFVWVEWVLKFWKACRKLQNSWKIIYFLVMRNWTRNTCTVFAVRPCQQSMTTTNCRQISTRNSSEKFTRKEVWWYCRNRALIFASFLFIPWFAAGQFTIIKALTVYALSVFFCLSVLCFLFMDTCDLI